MELFEGTVIEAPAGEKNGKIKEDEGGTIGEFVRGNIKDIVDGDRYSFLKIIQETPNGDKVMRILKKRLPE